MKNKCIAIRCWNLESWQRDNAEIANFHKQITKENTKDILVRQNKQHQIVEQDKAGTRRNHSKTKEMELDWIYVKKGKWEHCKTITRTSTARKKEKRKTPQQLEKKRNKGTRGNQFELDGHKDDSEE
jgi:hypothetical protein